jgi:peptide-methionine (S)-S-oxide reductase
MHPQRWILVVALALAAGYVWLRGGFIGILEINPAPAAAIAATAEAEPQGQGQTVATFASGCFWCTEADFDKVRGVISTTSGYTGGTVANPTYRQVSSGGTGHAEAVRVVFDPSIVSYEELLDHFWHNVDPFVANRQFCDVGNQYRPEIFFHTDAQRVAAETSKARMQKLFTEKIVVAISPAAAFYPAETYHQDYYKKNSAQYRFYRYACGRDRRLQDIWSRVQ